MSEAAMYTGQHLSDRAIRLLFLQASRNPQQPIQCDCRCYEIEAAPPYEALSYVWGADDPTTKVTILFDDDEVLIGRNLADALRRLRLPDSERVLWADALCINQKNNEEKSHQVPMMGSIYSKATRVIVWLGDGDPQVIGEAARCVRWVGRVCRDDTLEPEVFDAYKNLHIPAYTFTPTVCKCLEKLYDLPYFSRVWCIQEIRLARHITVLWGEEEISWDDVGRTAWWICDNESIMPALEEIRSDNAFLMYAPSTNRSSLLQTLDFYKYWQATDPRDKVYGLLNLVSPETEVEAIHLDYNKDIDEVEADVVLSQIRLYSCLTALAHVTHPSDYDPKNAVRSWAVSGNRDLDVLRIHPHEYNDTVSACKGQPVARVDSEHISLKGLCLRGIAYHTVATVYTVMTRDNTQDHDHIHSGNLQGHAHTHNIHPLMEAYKEIVLNNMLDSPLGTSSERLRRLARTLTAGWLHYKQRIQESDITAQETYYRAFNSMMKEVIHKATGQSGISRSSAQRTAFDGGADVSLSYCAGRRLFHLQNGSFGLGPQCMRPGDIVVVLSGGNFLFVVRLRCEQYLFIGAAYVDDIMNGELVDEVEVGNRQEREFFLV